MNLSYNDPSYSDGWSCWHRAKFKCSECSGNCTIKLDLEYIGELNEEFSCLLYAGKPKWVLQWRHELKE